MLLMWTLMEITDLDLDGVLHLQHSFRFRATLTGEGNGEIELTKS